ELALPYVPKYAYEEKLAVGAADRNEVMEKAYRKLAAYLGLMSPLLQQTVGAEWLRLFGGTLPRIPFMAPPLAEGYGLRAAVLAEGRDLLLARATAVPASSGAPAGAGKPVALVGVGGAGKTVLAAALCHESAVGQLFKNGILWASLGQAGNPL